MDTALSLLEEVASTSNEPIYRDEYGYNCVYCEGDIWSYGMKHDETCLYIRIKKFLESLKTNESPSS